MEQAAKQTAELLQQLYTDIFVDIFWNSGGMCGMSADWRYCGESVSDCVQAEESAWYDDGAWERPCAVCQYGAEHSGKYRIISDNNDLFAVFFRYADGDDS